MAALLVVLALVARGGHRSKRLAFVTVSCTWSAISGLLGVILIVGWTATRHSFMARNENLLQFDPLSLALAVLLPMAIMRGRRTTAARALATVIAAIALLGLALKLVPVFNQANFDVIALTLPAHIALAWAARVLTAAPLPATPPPASSARAAMSRSAA
jgi:hypothetical protein